MILDDEDKLYMNRIATMAMMDVKTVTNVFRAVLQTAVKEVYASGKNTSDGCIYFTIPGVCKLKADIYDDHKGRYCVTKVDLEATPKKALLAEINAINLGEETPDLKQMKENIKDHFKIKLDVE